jgi:seryl-tRNA synthetase
VWRLDLQLMQVNQSGLPTRQENQLNGNAQYSVSSGGIKAIWWIMIVMLENYQTADSQMRLPAVLQSYLGWEMPQKK